MVFLSSLFVKRPSLIPETKMLARTVRRNFTKFAPMRRYRNRRYVRKSRKVMRRTRARISRKRLYRRARQQYLTTRFVGSEQVLAIGTQDEIKNGKPFNLTCSLNGMTNDPVVQWSSYKQIFDKFKVNKVVCQFWITNNDEIAKAGNKLSRFYTVYDPDMKSRSASYYEIAKVNGARTYELLPGKQYSFSLSPKFDTSGVSFGIAKNIWLDCGKTFSETDNLTSLNGMLGSIFNVDITTNFVMYRNVYYVTFGNRRNGQAYQ